MRLGEIIKEYREKNRLSIEDFAKKSGISRAYIGMLEKGTDQRTGKRIMPSIAMIKKAAIGMGLGFDELFSMLDEEITLKDDSAQMDLATVTVINEMKEFTQEQKQLVHHNKCLIYRI